jgi:hypothetical protein
MLARYAVRGLGGPRDLEAGRRSYAQAVALGAAGAADELAAFDRALAAGAGTRAALDAPREAARMASE